MLGVKQKVLSMNDKICIIHETEKDKTNAEIGKMYSLSLSTVSTIWKNRKTIQSAFY